LFLFSNIVDEPMTTSMSNTSEEANVISEIKTPEEGISAPETLDYSSSSSYKDLAGTNSIFEKDNIPHSSGTSLSLSLSLSLTHTHPHPQSAFSFFCTLMMHRRFLLLLLPFLLLFFFGFRVVGYPRDIFCIHRV